MGSLATKLGGDEALARALEERLKLPPNAALIQAYLIDADEQFLLAREGSFQSCVSLYT